MSMRLAEYRLVIDAFTPDTLPMLRLSEYMADLARLLGEAERVHFVRVEAGSTVMVQQVDPQAEHAVSERIDAVARDNGSDEAVKAFNAINLRLAKDGATGSLQNGERAEVIRFPGRDQPELLTFASFTEMGALDGVLIRAGGKGDRVQVWLQDGSTVHQCKATRQIARAMAPHLYGTTLRVQGEGRWGREADGAWEMNRFYISGFEVLDDSPLVDVVTSLREIEGSDWKEIDDPFAELERLRHGVGEAH